MAMEISEKDYRKVVFDTENPFVSVEFSRFIGENKLFAQWEHKGLYSKYTLFLTDKELDKAEKAFFGMLDGCGKKMQALKEKQEFLLKFFDSANIFEAVSIGIECRMKAWESEPVCFNVYTDKAGELSWKQLLKSVKRIADVDTYSWYYNLNDRYLIEPSKDKKDLMDMAESIHDRLARCVEAIEQKIEEEEK